MARPDGDEDLEVGNFTQIGGPDVLKGFSRPQVLVFELLCLSHTMGLRKGYKDMWDSQFSASRT